MLERDAQGLEPERGRVRFFKLYRCEYTGMPEDRSAELKTLAADFIGRATGTTDPIARAAFLAMAQRLLDLAHEPLGTRRFQELLKDFNQRQMDQDWRRLPRLG